MSDYQEKRKLETSPLLNNSLILYSRLKDEGYSENTVLWNTRNFILNSPDSPFLEKKYRKSDLNNLLSNFLVDVLIYYQAIENDEYRFPEYLPPKNFPDLTEDELFNDFLFKDKSSPILMTQKEAEEKELFLDQFLEQHKDKIILTYQQKGAPYGYKKTPDTKVVSDQEMELYISKKKTQENIPDLTEGFFYPLEFPELGITGIIENINPRELPSHVNIDVEYPVMVGQNYDDIYRIRFTIPNYYTNIYMLNKKEKLATINLLALTLMDNFIPDHGDIQLLIVNYPPGLEINCPSTKTLENCPIIRKNRTVIIIKSIIPDIPVIPDIPE